MNDTSSALLGPAEIRDLAGRLGVRPTKTLGQNFLHDGGTVRKIVRIAALRPGERVVEVGPGLGSLTLGLVEDGASVVAIEIDPVLAGQISETVHARFPESDFEVVLSDAMDVTTLPGAPPTALVANLPYNVAVPVLLTMLQRFDSLERVLVMVQAEVADRIAAVPGSKIYGIPSVKAAWYASARRAGTVGRNVFWPAPNVDSALVHLERRDPPSTTASREQVFAVVDAAFAQRRKTLRAALSGLFGSGVAAETALRAAGVDPSARGETLGVEQFARIAEQVPQGDGSQGEGAEGAE
ncbi:16S rRNA (adenine(1518)-N(6)/adenine(1519)-N(6))-dimethyltransferase RsmA [Promicromonospora sp. Populi]|uniref:16S rRNA (adenine(1518)-N(6)/adenine(1519)-N(6))- dimethyltransferase RsmA n=1 Tax=Promicromonospora sp. Populi TaxID=3239420 RepID=UPI0034E2FEAA